MAAGAFISAAEAVQAVNRRCSGVGGQPRQPANHVLIWSPMPVNIAGEDRKHYAALETTYRHDTPTIALFESRG